MAKDALGHGSDTRGFRLVKTHTLGPHSAKIYKPPGDDELVVKTYRNGAYQSKNDYFTNDMGDANGTAMSQLNRWVSQDATSRPVGSGSAASELASGAKSATIPTHDSMGTSPISINGTNAMMDKARAGALADVNGRHGYNRDAVNNAIASSNRAGRRIGGREASAIHRLLKGR